MTGTGAAVASVGGETGALLGDKLLVYWMNRFQKAGSSWTAIFSFATIESAFARAKAAGRDQIKLSFIVFLELAEQFVSICFKSNARV
jgi:hypothetical protein